MAKLIVVFDDDKLNTQFREIIDNLSPENFEYNNPTIRSTSGEKLFKLVVDDSGNLSTEEV